MKIDRMAVMATMGLTAVATLGGCGSTGDSSSSDGTSSTSTVTVVASTDVWGDVVGQVAGDLTGSRVKITSIISNPEADPHSYEANTQNQLALSKADLVVENGGGYDDFVDSMLKTAGNSSVTLLNAVEISGRTPPSDGELNEHVWYDFPTVRKVVARVEEALAKADPKNASTYADNGRAFDQQLASLEQQEAAIKSVGARAGVAITEPVPLYLLQACGLENMTPEAFSEGIEEGTDVSPAVLKQTEDLFIDHRVKLLAYNEQTSGPETEAVLKVANANKIAVVPVTETLPSGKDYLSWMRGNLSAIRSALG